MTVTNEIAERDGGARLLREFTTWSAFSLAFAFISPIVALYSIFSFGLTSIGPAFWWGFPVTLVGQLLVAISFGMLVSRFPLEGSVYQWSRHIMGGAYGWFAGWAYIWTLPIAFAAVALSGATFVAQFLGLDSANSAVTIPIAIAMIIAVTIANTFGRNALKFVVGLCIMAEIVGSVGLGIILLAFYRVNDISVLSQGLFTGTDNSFSWSQMMFAVALAGWAFVGFESAGSIAEEVKNPQRAVPKSMIISLLFVAAIVAFSGLSFILAMPDLDQVRAGTIADPVAHTIAFHFGAAGLRAMAGVFSIGFVACMLGLQTSVSRVIWAFAREGELPGANILGKLSANDHLPLNAIWAAGILSLIFFALSFTNIYTMLLTFTTAGFYISFLMPALAAGIEVLTKGPQKSPFNLGRWSATVTLLAAAWLIFQTINICWPRSPQLPWYENWATVLVVAILAAAGVVIRLFLPRTR